MAPSLPGGGRKLIAVLSLIFALTVFVPRPVAHAQTTSGTLVGTVYKPDGEPLGGARVTATNELNGNARSTVTALDGSYRIPFMPPGRYTIRASFTGFTDSQITGFPIPLNSTTNLVPPNGRMVIIAVDQGQIRVGAARPLLNTAIKFLDMLSPADRVAFVAYPEPGIYVDFTNDKLKLKLAMERVVGAQQRFSGKYNIGLYEAIQIAEKNDERTFLELLARTP